MAAIPHETGEVISKPYLPAQRNAISHLIIDDLRSSKGPNGPRIFCGGFSRLAEHLN
jgi:hypothetical protein